MRKTAILSLIAIFFTTGITNKLLSKTLSSDMNENPVIYHIFVRSFFDSNQDGIGDLNGIAQKLDYLDSLQVTSLRISSLFEAPGYDNKDISDFMSIDPDYGSNEDLISLVNAAHQKGMKVILDIYYNQVSVQHPWFQKAIKKKKKYIDYFSFSSEEAVIEKNKYQWFELPSESKLKETHYFSDYWKSIPDLNFQSENLRTELEKQLLEWQKQVNIDGFFFNDLKSMISPENKPILLNWFSTLSNKLKESNPGFLLYGDTPGKFSTTEELLSSGFDVLYNQDFYQEALNMATSSFKYVKTLEEQFAQNHSDYGFGENLILSLGSLDDPRIHSLLSRENQNLASILQLTLPGIPMIYYGNEIGMPGDKPDEYIREPFLWGNSPDYTGQTNWEIPFYTKPGNTKPFEMQKSNPESMLGKITSLLKIRNQYPELKYGKIRFFPSINKDLIAYFRVYEDQSSLILMNPTDNYIRIKTSIGLKSNSDVIYKSHGIFKRSGNSIVLQPKSAFILRNKVVKLIF